jgi:hypothetical protein
MSNTPQKLWIACNIGLLAITLPASASADELKVRDLQEIESCIKDKAPDLGVVGVYTQKGDGTRARASLSGKIGGLLADGAKVNSYVDLKTGAVVDHEGLSALGIRGGDETKIVTPYEGLHPEMRLRVNEAVNCYWRLKGRLLAPSRG